ncbi:MAG: hypothetical protein IJ662_02665 [Clostridia bacterium]|nr:hypothetical protein [Clostridia bacterium]
MPELKDWRCQGMSTARMEELHRAEVEIAICSALLAAASASGLPVDAIKKRLEAAQKEKAEVQEWINAVSDARIRSALTLKYLRGWTWDEVAEICSGKPENLKKACQRFVAAHKYDDPAWL